MQKIYIILAAIASIALSACSDSNKEVNKIFVGASLKMTKAAELFNNAEYVSSRALSVEAKSAVDKILADYPDSNIALSLVSQSDTQVGVCSYKKLSQDILTKLTNLTLEDVKDVDLAWAVASSFPLESRDIAYATIAYSVMQKCSDGGANFFKSPRKIVVACISKVENPKIKSDLARRMAIVFDGAKELDVSQKNLSEQPISATTLQKPKNEALFLNEARTEAALVSYDISAINKLKARVPAAKTLQNPTEFLKILRFAYGVSEKITMPGVRDLAASRLIEVFVEFGAIKDAVELAQNINEQNSIERTAMILAENISSKDDCDATLKIADKIKNIENRDAFYAKLSENLCDKHSTQAIKIASKISDKQKRYVAFVNLGETSGNIKVFADALSEIDLNASYDWIKTYQQKETINPAAFDQIEAVRKFAQISNAVLKTNPALAKKLNDKAASIDCNVIVNSDKSRKELTYAYMLIAINKVKMGDSASALDFLTKQMHRLDVSGAFAEYATIAAEAYPKNPEAALKALSVAADLCPSLRAENSVKFPIYLAYIMQINGVSRKDAVKILENYMPKFEK